MASALPLDSLASVRYNVSFDADYTLNSSLRSSLKQSISRAHSTMVGDGYARLTVSHNPVNIVVDAWHAVEQRKLAVTMEINEIIFHSRFIPFRFPTMILQTSLVERSLRW